MKGATRRRCLRSTIAVVACASTFVVHAQEAEPFPHGDAAKIAGQVCVACHGPDGNSLVPIFPKLAGQQEVYLAKQLADFKAGRRQSEVMAPSMALIDRSDVPSLAAYFATRSPAAPGAGDGDLARGRALFETGDRDAGIAACSACHEARAEGDGRYARLAGQSATYTAQTLADFKSGTRHNDKGRVMRNIAARLADADMQSVAAYLASR